MALSGDTNPGFAAVNSDHKKFFLEQAVDGYVHIYFLPFTAFHKVGIVASYSYSEIVKPERCRVHEHSST